jgi:hypothetical protein
MKKYVALFIPLDYITIVGTLTLLDQVYQYHQLLIFLSQQTENWFLLKIVDVSSTRQP